MVKQHYILVTRYGLYEFLYTLATAVAAIITTNDNQIADANRVIPQNADASIIKKGQRFVNTCNILVVAQTGYNRSVETPQLFDCTLRLERAHIAVNQVTGDEDEVGMFGIDQINPAANLGTAVMKASMHITQHDDFHGMFQWFIGR